MISSTCFFPCCSFSSRYIQLVWSSWNFSSLVITRRARSLADTWLLGTDWGRAGTPSRMIASVKAAELCTCLIAFPLRNHAMSAQRFA